MRTMGPPELAGPLEAPLATPAPLPAAAAAAATVAAGPPTRLVEVPPPLPPQLVSLSDGPTAG